MDRRRFLTLTAGGMLSALASARLTPLFARPKAKVKKYSIVVLGDTHYDTEPADVYHSNYMEKVDWLNKVQRAEFKRNGEMWRDRCRRLVKRASRLIDKSTRMVLQTGDLIQGDCGKAEVHHKMLADALNYMKSEMQGLPFITVVGNHDIRGTNAKQAYTNYMPDRMSIELGQKITKTTFSFWIGRDVYLCIDFNTPDDAEIERLLDESKDARYTFILIHGALFPMDSKNCRWVFHGGENDNERRRYFRRRFAERNVICICGHTHTTEFYDWEGDGGRITQVTVNSVWANEARGKYTINAQGAAQYGELRKKADNGDGTYKDETALFDEYRPGLRTWTHSPAAGSYRLNVSDKGVTLDFYAGDSEECSHQFKLR